MSKKLRLFLGMIAHETNTFSPIPTSVTNFKEAVFFRCGDMLSGHPVAGFPAFADVLQIARQRADDIHIGLSTWTQPSGIVSRAAYETLREELLDNVRAAGEVDAVVLVLHGAMVADGYTDCEGDLLTRLRTCVGPKVPIGALLDLHGNMSDAMIDSGALLIACKEYPHVDYPERAKELYDLLINVGEGRLTPRSTIYRVPMVGLFGTTEEPMKGFMRSVSEREGKNGVLSISVMHGFPWSDTPHTGAAILVLHDGRNAAYAEQLAREVGNAFYDLRNAARLNQRLVNDALDHCGTFDQGRPVVLADGADNPGGGAACDSTFVLRAMLQRQTRDAALGMIWDPQAARFAADAGVGATLKIRLGGKTSPFSGDPLDVTAKVLAVRHDATQPGLGGAGQDSLGLAVALRIDGIDVVVNSIRQQVFSTDCFTNLGIAINAKRLVVVKSSQHFRASFDPIAAGVVYCRTPGSLNPDLSTLPYEHVHRPLWPLDGE